MGRGAAVKAAPRSCSWSCEAASLQQKIHASSARDSARSHPDPHSIGLDESWENVAPTQIKNGEKWTATVCLLANDYAYPHSRGGDATSSCAAQHDDGEVLGVNPHDSTKDEASVLSALYGSAMGVQTTLINSPLGAVVGAAGDFAEGSCAVFYRFSLFYDCFTTILRLIWVYFDGQTISSIRIAG